MTRVAEMARVLCRQPWPQQSGVYCTRLKDHKGGHLDENQKVYWQAEETSS
jgi:hypothetical protein